ncbi:hypothetical protein QBC47DRAFT_329518 [Echria macrotheca]|uniref:C2H2-type domain-containing protein n=1 Tax=Echria macrotheca TaxID=438768 RepID=A0AAJ0B7E1_9PEZI|nr:hypothetical protein QBC47DRAFT_329518 [Echria macrotheca]
MKRRAEDQGDNALKKNKITDSASGDDGADSGSVFSGADSTIASTVRPTQTAPATTITASTRASRKFPSDLKTIPCTFPGCDKTFNRPARLTAHLRSHTNDRAFRCPYEGCGKDYLEEKHLAQHIKGTHTHEKRYTCEVPDCGKSFVTATRLRRHAAVHEGAERFRCRDYEGCNQSFRKHQTLQRHIRTVHLGESAFVCNNGGCKSGFDTAGALRRHIQREHGELKFWCDECAKEEDDDGESHRVGFTTMALLENHMKREHIACPFCDAKCRSDSHLEKHIDMLHSGTSLEERKTVPCEWEGCNKTFTRKSNLYTHIRTAHQGMRFKCGEVDTFGVEDITDWNWQEEGCGQEFYSKSKLEEHIRFVHLGRRRPPKTYTISTELPDPNELMGVVSKYSVLCTVEGCPARFVRHSELDKHMQNEHADMVVSAFPVDPLLELGGPAWSGMGEGDADQQGYDWGAEIVKLNHDFGNDDSILI